MTINGGKPMNGNNSMTEGKTSERLSDNKQLEFQWKTIDWKKAEKEVNRLQARIVKATQQKDWNSVKRLQYLLTHSFYAKALAVKKVTTNKGKKTAGVDGELWDKPAIKMKAVLALTDKCYKAKPLRRVYIAKKDKKKTNVDMSNRIICFDIKSLGKTLKKLGMLVVQDAVWNRVTVNREQHKYTRFYIDEFHRARRSAA